MFICLVQIIIVPDNQSKFQMLTLFSGRHILPIYTWNQHFWAYTSREINILLFSKWNRHPFRHVSREINIFTYLDLKSTFLSLYTVLN